MAPPSVPDHCASTFKYFLAVVKNTKTSLRAYMCDTEGVYRRLITTKNNSKDIKRRAFLWCRFLQTPGEEITKRRKKMIPPAIGENYINEKFLFL